jgi:ubiquinone biosynthesis monooxygenase Coq7
VNGPAGPHPASAPLSARRPPLPDFLAGELRSDHAGEWGAVMIYRGILALSRDEAVRAFAREHLATEQDHLAFFEGWLPAARKSRILPLWRVAGWTLGAAAALGGRRWVYRTIEAVETFVDEHYRVQIDALEAHDPEHPLLDVLRRFRADEVDHRDDAARRLGPAPTAGGSGGGPPSLPERAWAGIVDRGSRWAVGLAKRF